MREINRALFLGALNRLRRQLFGNDSLKIFQMTPEAGETVAADLIVNWSGREVASATDSEKESGFWQFQIAADDDWQTSQAFMFAAVALKIGDRRWKVKKVKKPIGKSRVWKIRAEIQ